jgi:2-polyprenyl-3-methyl-5-hydroxy-6-metoxy-1,4-benzoquinol methylase
MKMGLFNYIHHKISEVWKNLHKENADPLKLPNSIRRGVYWIREKTFLPFVKNKDVLELGCGYGYTAFLFSKVAKNVIGVDIDSEAIEKARSNYQNVPNLNFIIENALTFLWKNLTKFDVIALFEVIEHIDAEKQKELIKKIHEALKPGGQLFLSTPNGKFVPFYRKNPFHKHELSVKELLELVNEYFEVEMLKGQIPLFWFFIPLPWAWLEKIWMLLGIYEKIHQIRDNPENSRTILLRAKKKVKFSNNSNHTYKEPCLLRASKFNKYKNNN